MEEMEKEMSDSYIVYKDSEGDVINSFNITDQLGVQMGILHLTDFALVEQLQAEVEKHKKERRAMKKYILDYWVDKKMYDVMVKTVEGKK